MAGYIKLHRQLLDSYQFSNPDYLKIWLWILLKASYRQSKISLEVNSGFSDVMIERGQFIFGRASASKQLKMSESKIYRVIKKFEKDKAINIKSNNKYSIITVCKYDDYNNENLESEQPVNSQRTASEQPVNTIKKDKKVNKEKNIFIAPLIDEVANYFFENGYSLEVGKRAFNYYNSAGWKDRNGKQVSNWKQKMQGVWFKEENKITTGDNLRKLVY